MSKNDQTEDDNRYLVKCSECGCVVNDLAGEWCYNALFDTAYFVCFSCEEAEEDFYNHYDD